MPAIWIYADKATIVEDGRYLAVETSDGLVMVRLPKEGITKGDEEEE